MKTAAQLVAEGYYGYAGWPDDAAYQDFLATGGAGKGGPTQQPTQVAQPTVAQAQPTGQPAGGQPRTAQDLVNMGYYGYQGWPDEGAIADFRATGGQGKGGPTPTAGAGAGAPTMPTFAQPTINLPEVYTGLFEASGISKLEEDLSKKTESFNEAVSKINDNPFLSEANRVGRIQKLQTDFNNATIALRGEIATKRADVETQMNLQTQQFNIESQQAQQALSQFNALLSAGALDTATGEDIANMTRATGISSTMIQSAIDARTKKEPNVTVKTFTAENGEVFAVALNADTGEMVNKTSLGIIGNIQTGRGLSVTQQREADEQVNTQDLIGHIKRGATLRWAVSTYGVAGGLSVEDIYRLYNTYTRYDPAKESLEDVKEGKFVA